MFSEFKFYFLKKNILLIFVILLIIPLIILFDRYYLKQIRLKREDALLDMCFCEKTKQGFPITLNIINPSIEKLKKKSFVAVSFEHSCNIKDLKAYIKYDKNDVWEFIDTLRSCDNYSVIRTCESESVFFKIEGYSSTNKFLISDSINLQLKESDKSEYLLKKVIDSANFKPRDGAGCVEFKDKLFLIGGWSEDKNYTYTNNEIWSSIDAKNWSLESLATFEGRHCFGIVKFKNGIWLVGGDCNNGNCQKDVWKSFDGNIWTKVSGPLNFLDRALYSVVVFKNKLWLFGGQKMPKMVSNHEGDIWYNDAWSSEDGISWKLESSQLDWSGRSVYNRIVVHNNSLYLFGGDHYQLKTFNDVWKSEDGVNWEKISYHSPWKQAQFSDVIVYDEKFWIVGGSYHGNNINEIWYSEDAISWSKLDTRFFPSRHASSLVVFQNKFFIIAGNLRNDVWEISKKK
jgi:hypothetical protein